MTIRAILRQLIAWGNQPASLWPMWVLVMPLVISGVLLIGLLTFSIYVLATNP